MDSAATLKKQEATRARCAAGSKPVRRSQRVNLRIPVVAYGHPACKHPAAFEESTYVVRVSAHGGQLELARDLERGDCFMLRYADRPDEQTECRVVNISKTQSGARLLGFEFTRGLVDFWRMSFPPPGARPILERIK